MGWLDSIGQKVKKVAGIVGAAKGIYDVGKGICTAGQYIALLLVPYYTKI